jgi:hypothetical protein
MTDREACRLLGKNVNYFSVMRVKSPDKFKYIKSISRNLYQAHKVYEEEVMAVQNQAQQDYYELSEEWGKVRQFSKYLYEKGIYKHPNIYSASASRVLFNSRQVKDGYSLTHKSFITYKKINQLYKEFKKWECT